MEHEASFLKQIMLDNNLYFQYLPKEWWFTNNTNKGIFRTIEKLISENHKADEAAVSLEMNSSEPSMLAEKIYSTANVKYYAELCKEQGAKQKLRYLGKVLQSDETIDTLIEHATETIEEILIGGNEYRIQSVSDKLLDVINDIEERYKSRGSLPGLSTGFQRFDDYTGGLQADKLYIIGARPSQGKSALALNMAFNVAKENPVGFVSLENSIKEILIREISSVARINSQHLASGFFSESDFNYLNKAASDIYERQVYMFDKPNCGLNEVVAHCRLMKQKGVEAIFLDYLQLIQNDAETDRERVSRSSKRLKDLARELHIPIIALAQLRRDSDGRRPGLGDFQHSSQIEQDADIGALIWHRVVSKDTGRSLGKVKVEDPDTEDLQIYLLLDKVRDGRVGHVRLDFDAEYITFREAAIDKNN